MFVFLEEKFHIFEVHWQVQQKLGKNIVLEAVESFKLKRVS